MGKSLLRVGIAVYSLALSKAEGVGESFNPPKVEVSLCQVPPRHGWG